MGYIEELRALVGSRPLLLIGASVLILDDLARVLLQRRADNGLWGIVGGYSEPGESLEETARREALEETGLVLGDLRLLDVFSGPDFFYTYPNGDQVYIITVAYVAGPYPWTGIACHTHEALEVKFFSLHELPDHMTKTSRAVLSRFRTSLSGSLESR